MAVTPEPSGGIRVALVPTEPLGAIERPVLEAILLSVANVLATIPGDVDRWIVVGAHHDHLGKAGASVYHGADDNAAAVAILVDVAAVADDDALYRAGVVSVLERSGYDVVGQAADPQEFLRIVADTGRCVRIGRRPVEPRRPPVVDHRGLVGDDAHDGRQVRAPCRNGGERCRVGRQEMPGSAVATKAR